MGFLVVGGEGFRHPMREAGKIKAPRGVLSSGNPLSVALRGARAAIPDTNVS